ncbi:hypothetical protein Tco_0895297 [Tanacetum coccineum]|uniref:Uncharacterized protein n=1 Tax=Tanacetum coccineum TaxID=301880 RepID=A0ABQ5CE80_9ASTR
MPRTNSQAEIVYEEQLVPRANRLVIKMNNQRMPIPDPNSTYTKPPSEIQILEFIKTLGYAKDPKTKTNAISKMVATRLHQPWRAILSVLNRCLTGKDSSWDTVKLSILQILCCIVHSANLDFASLIWDEFEWQTVERSSRPSKMSKLLYTRFTKLIIDYILSHNKILDAMISDAIKKKAGYTYYMAKKVEREKAKIVDEPEEQHGQKLKGLAVEDPVIQSLLDLRKGSKASRLESLRQKKQPVAGEGSSAPHNKYYSSSDAASDATLYSSSSDKPKKSANETDDADESNMDLSNDNPHGDDDAARYRVFMHNKPTATPNSTYLSPKVISSSLDFIQTLLDETPENELTDFMSHPVYTDAHATLVVHNPEGKPELTSYISGASEVPLGTHVDVLATTTLMQ